MDTPERGQPGAKEVAAALSSLVAGERVDVEPFSQDRYDRMIGTVHRGDLDVNLELVRRGHAWAYCRYMREEDSGLCIAVAAARAARKGLWASLEQQVVPSEWRRKNLWVVHGLFA